jgi:hypothetical protein
MRVFSKDEERILSRLDELAGTLEQQKKGEINPVNLYSLIQLKLNEAGFVVDITNSAVTVTFENDPQQNSTRLGEIQLIIVQSVNLLKLLEDKGYIYTFKKEISLDLIPFGKYNFTNPSAPYSFSDKRIVELVIKYSTEEIYPTLELNHFVKVDNFQTRELARFNKQYKRTTTALVVAIIALVANIAFNVYTNFIKPNGNKTVTPQIIQNKTYDTSKNNFNFKKQITSVRDSIKKDSSNKSRNKKKKP